MRRVGWTWCLGLGLVTPTPAIWLADEGDLSGQTVLQITLGARDTEPTTWEGTVKIEPGTIVEAEGVAFEGPDRVAVDGSFRCQTRRRRPNTAAQRARGRENMPMGPTGLVLRVAGTRPESRVTVTTGAGEATAPLAAFETDRIVQLRGQVQFQSLHPGQTILDTADFNDSVAAAVGPDGRVHVAFVRFTPGESWRTIRNVEEQLQEFERFAESPGADQLFLITRAGATWGEPVALTEPGRDLYRPALTVAGDGTIWVFWSENVGCDKRFMNGDWELLARPITDGRPGDAIRLTRAPGADIFPSAATDSAGRVWVAWMAFRGGDAQILATSLEAGGFTPPTVIGNSLRNDWRPEVATSDDGQVAVVWDTYDKGDYDVRARLWREGRWLETVTVSNALTGEMNATAAFDRAGRLWLAYEKSPVGWGKDFGAAEKSYQPLYAGREVEVRVLENGRLLAPRQPLQAALDGVLRGPNQAPKMVAALPVIAADGAGRMWVTTRLKWPNNRTGPGTVWQTYAQYYSGEGWSAPKSIARTDAILDVRPALLPTRTGLLALTSTDNRRLVQPGPAGQTDDLVAGLVSAPEAPAELALEPVALAAVEPETTTEPADIARLREYRWRLNGQTLLVRRGEFHRHTEISSDGGGDGALLDMWRYGLGAADLDWLGNGDHDNGGGREQCWWRIQKTTDIFYHPPRFTPLFTYERSNNYPDGHRNVAFAERGVRPLPRYRNGLGREMDDLPLEAPRPHSPDSLMLWDYLKTFNGIAASHTSATDMGTDWRDWGGDVEPVVEIYQGDRQNYEMPAAPRANREGDSIGGWRPYGFVSYALQKGYRLGFQASSDHISTHMSYCNLLVTEPTRAALLEAFRKRRVYGSTDNIVGELKVRVGAVEHLMGEEFRGAGPPVLEIKLIGAQPLAKVTIVRDNRVVHVAEPNTAEVDLRWQDNQPQTGRTTYYYVRGEQVDGELVWLSPVWIAL